MPKIIKNISAVIKEKRNLGKPLSKHVKALMALKKNEGFTEKFSGSPESLDQGGMKMPKFSMCEK